MSERIVDDLEAIEIEEYHRHEPVAPVGFHHGLAQPVLQQHAIGQSGERVVMRQIIQPFLRAAMFGDVLDGTDETRGITVVAALDFGLGAHDAFAAVRADEAVLRGVGPDFIGCSGDVFNESLPVIRMDHVQERVE